jgi:predicted dehydrogenase
MVEAVLLGAGNRGRFTYGAYAKAHPDRLRIVALAEPDAQRRRIVADELGLAAARVFDDWKALLDGPSLAPVAIVATGDDLHVAPALAALERGHHVLLEKPIAPTPGECLRVVEAAERYGRILQISHVLRYTPFYQHVREILASGVLGELVHVDMREHVAFWHMTHSYVRGKFCSSRSAAPFVLAKTCHDLDLLAWFADRPALRVASFGGLLHFRAQDAPSGAPLRCLDGCPVQQDCPHDAVRFYLDPDERIAALWPWSDLSPDPSREARRRALEEGPWGRCVYRCDNDVADHQVLSLEFEGGLTASFAVHGLASEERRTIRVSGTRGELRGVLHEGLIETSRHGRFGWERHALPEASPFGHFGGDPGLLDHFTDAVARGDAGAIRASGRSALESHWMGFAAEESRSRGSVVEMAAVRAAARDAVSRA